MPSDLSFFEHLDDERDNFWRQALRRLVQQDDGRIGHQGAANGQHLLLAAGQGPPVPFLHLVQPWKHVENALGVPPRAFLLEDLQILVRRKRREDASGGRHIGDPGSGDHVRFEAGDVPAVERSRCPAFGGASPMTLLIVVVLPAPLRPRMATSSPASTVMETPFSMCTRS